MRFTYNGILSLSITVMKEFRYLLILILALTFGLFEAQKAIAVPAYPRKVYIDVPNGKLVEICMHGDEYHKFATTTEGYSILSDSLGWWYVMQNNDGSVSKSHYMLVAEDDESEELKDFKSNCPKWLVTDNVNRQAYRHAQASRQDKIVSNHTKGEVHALVILMQYKDLPFSKTADDFKALFNKTVISGRGSESVREYYRFVSQNQMDYISDVYGPYTSNNRMSYYGGNDSYGNDSHPLELCVEAILNLPKDIDFSIYDNNDDGVVDNVHIIFAGYGEESGASSNSIWSHEYPHRISLKSEIGYSFAGYSCSPELQGNRGSSISNIGVACHELGHSLGAMDYYDTNYNTAGNYIGTGRWDIMADGSWNDDGRTPCNFNPYVRSEVFGWTDQTLLTPNQHIVIPRMEQSNADASTVYRMETMSDGDYFLIENRQQFGADSAIPGSGLMIYHVHPDIEIYRKTNAINSTHPQCFYPVCASGSYPNIKQYGDINSTGCPFPGSNSVNSFTPSSRPAAIAWDGSSSGISIYGIRNNAVDGSVSFYTEEGNPIDPGEPTIYDESTVYNEGFENGLTDDMSVISITGDNKWRVYKKGNFATDSEYIPDALEGFRILMLFSGKYSKLCESDFVGPYIDIESGNKYLLAFSVLSQKLSTNFNPALKVYLEDEYGEYEIYSQTETIEEWTEVKVPITSAGNRIRFKFNGHIYSGGIFIDDIKLYCESQLSDPVPLTFIEQDDTFVFDLNGIPREYNGYNQSDIPSGVYIIRQRGKIGKIYIP